MKKKILDYFHLIHLGFVWFPTQNLVVGSYDSDKILICGGEDKNGNLFIETFLFDINNKKIYTGKDLICIASFRKKGYL